MSTGKEEVVASGCHDIFRHEVHSSTCKRTRNGVPSLVSILLYQTEKFRRLLRAHETRGVTQTPNAVSKATRECKRISEARTQWLLVNTRDGVRAVRFISSVHVCQICSVPSGQDQHKPYLFGNCCPRLLRDKFGKSCHAHGRSALSLNR